MARRTGNLWPFGSAISWTLLIGSPCENSHFLDAWMGSLRPMYASANLTPEGM